MTGFTGAANLRGMNRTIAQDHEDWRVGPAHHGPHAFDIYSGPDIGDGMGIFIAHVHGPDTPEVRETASTLAAAKKMLASLRAILPYAESRAEDMIEAAEEREEHARIGKATGGDASRAEELAKMDRLLADKAVAAVDAAKALLASLDAEG